MSNIKTVPNQKVVKVQKEPCNKSNLYAAINLEAMEKAAQELAAPAFKLWIYFAKNQNNYEFALSSKAVSESFGMKIDQYNGAMKALIDKGYLIQEKGNQYSFQEVSVMGKSNNEKEIKSSLQENPLTTLLENPLTTLQENPLTMLQENPLRNTTIYNTINTTIDNTTTASAHKCALPTQEHKATEGAFVAQEDKPKPMTEKERRAHFMAQW